jgi:hypothetical protein
LSLFLLRDHADRFTLLFPVGHRLDGYSCGRLALVRSQCPLGILQ